MALLGGVHGDEDEGVLAVWRVLRELEGVGFRGVVRAVAPANPAAWAARCRRTPEDDADLARSFPGEREGAPTETLADGITAAVIEGADLLIDLHSAGVRYSMPLFCGVGPDERGLRAARAFGAPTIWLHDTWPPGRSLTAAKERGIPAIYAECGGGGGVRSADLDAYVTGVLAVLSDLDMLPPHGRPLQGQQPRGEVPQGQLPQGERPQGPQGPQGPHGPHGPHGPEGPEGPVVPRWVRGSGDLDAGVTSTRAGLFSTTAAAGDLVPAGGEVGRLYGYDGRLLEVIRAARAGVLMFLRRQARVMPGDVLFVSAGECEGP
ncbi:M14 family metallopeptidase [Kribbella solani]|uniref:succinylglutamate desuccinylase/aspartoacylase family protein n=1 Tax=Kribbella solani TaxID=236067 RepID=UPI0029A79BA5|nr:M14 family metallopeptidase [Kribbella solani]MDX3000828.1 M14 family metallopeptidase [Kribbella solani]